MGTILLHLLAIGFAIQTVRAESVCVGNVWHTQECIEFLDRTVLALQSQVNALSVQLNTQANLIAAQSSQLSSQLTQLTETRTEVVGLRANPVPIGFIYVQLSNQQSPDNIWPTVTWQDITNTYAGLFFRALGGESSDFGVTQADNSPRINQVNTITTVKHNYMIDVSANDGVSAGVSTGAHPAPGNHWALRFRQSAGEVRPRNQAVRIWRRTY